MEQRVSLDCLKGIKKDVRTVRIMRIIPRTGDTKTGPVFATYSARNTCPDRCTFKCNGCYGNGIRTKKVWDSASFTNGAEGSKSDSLEGLALALRNVPAGALVRHNIAGDISEENSSRVNLQLLKGLTAVYAAANVRAFSYTHCEQNARTFNAIKTAQEKGFVINISCETISQADRAIKNGCHPFLVVKKDEILPERSPAGNKFILCPFEAKGIQCIKCGLCANPNRKGIVYVHAHGAVRQIGAALDAANDR